MTNESDSKVYTLAKSFLIDSTPKEVDEKLIEYYLTAPNSIDDPVKITDLYMRLLESAQNANMKAGVIGRSIGGIKNLSTVLFNFDPNKVIEEYFENHEKLLDEIIEEIKPKGKIRRESQSIWPQYCRTILSAAEFFSQFKNSSDFYEWANYFYKDEKSFAALPMILGEEIYGIAFPLACDFLKELGFVNFGKPDVHIKQIFKSIGLVKLKASDYQVLKAITRIASNAGVTPYNVDKLFWLIGSGYFYDHPHIGNKGRIGRRKDEFIAYYKSFNA